MQAKRRQPLVRLGIFRTPALGAANVAQFLLGAAWVPMWFFLNLYLQQVLGLSAFPSGAALLPMTVLIMVGMVLVAPRAIARFGPKRGPGRRHGCARGRARAARPGPPGRQLRRRRAARLAGRGGRHEPGVHPVPGHRHLLGPPRGRRAGGRHREHQLPGRVRSRPGRDDRRRGRERRRPARRRVLADRRLLGRVPRGGRRRRRRRGHRRRHPAAAEGAAARRPRRTPRRSRPDRPTALRSPRLAGSCSHERDPASGLPRHCASATRSSPSRPPRVPTALLPRPVQGAAFRWAHVLASRQDDAGVEEASCGDVRQGRARLGLGHVARNGPR